MASRSSGQILKRRRLTLVKQIGEGSFGKALLVQGDNGALLVCKMIDVSQATQKETQESVKEAKLLASFKHPFIVEYVASFVDDGWLCILMAYCAGGDLFSQVDKARQARKYIEEDLILRWLTQAVLALKYIHDKHILHRDLKTGNFFLDNRHNLKLGDFGIAKVLNRTQACARTQIGTPLYLSPEACQEKPYGWASDIWAMGVVLYELCSLKLPFDGGSNMIVLVRSICSGTPTPLPSVYSDFCHQLCADMLRKDPNTRPACGAILQRPRLQQVVTQLFGEAKNPAVVPADGPYKVADLVEYHSNSHGTWLPAVITRVDPDGCMIDLKPGVKISKEQMEKQLRFRTAEQPAPESPDTAVAAAEDRTRLAPAPVEAPPAESKACSTQALDKLLAGTGPAEESKAALDKQASELSLEDECTQLLQELGMEESEKPDQLGPLPCVPDKLSSLRAAEVAVLQDGRDLCASLTAAELDLLAASLQV